MFLALWSFCRCGMPPLIIQYATLQESRHIYRNHQKLLIFPEILCVDQVAGSCPA